MFNVLNRGMNTKSFKEIVPIKQSSSGPTNSANKLPPLKSMGVWQDSLSRRYFLLSDSTGVDIREYATLYSVCIPQLSDHSEWGKVWYYTGDTKVSVIDYLC